MKTKFCPNFPRIAHKSTPTGIVMVRLRCKSWQCEYCAEANRQMWRSHLGKMLAKLNLDWWFGTITAPSWLRTPEDSLQVIRTNFDRFMKRLRRVFGKVEYARVYETHEKGAFHLHLVVSGLSPFVTHFRSRSGSLCFRPAQVGGQKGTWSMLTWWKKTLSKCGLGYIADIKQIPPYAAVKYVTKYMTKSAQAFYVPGLRQIQTTRGIGSPKPAGIEIWAVSGALWGSDINYQAFIDADKKQRIPAEYWHAHVTYPE